MEEIEKNKKLTEHKLSGKELYELRRNKKGKAKKKEIRKEKLREAPRKIGRYIRYTIIIVAIIGGIVFAVSLIPKLPPTTGQNHSEIVPPDHILTEPISDVIQRHMIEHADGIFEKGPGILIQYNCEDFACEPDLIKKLSVLAEEYPDNVYLAPNNYSGKIILTKLGKREILNTFDEQAIKDFIE